MTFWLVYLQSKMSRNRWPKARDSRSRILLAGHPVLMDSPAAAGRKARRGRLLMSFVLVPFFWFSLRNVFRGFLGRLSSDLHWFFFFGFHPPDTHTHIHTHRHTQIPDYLEHSQNTASTIPADWQTQIWNQYDNRRLSYFCGRDEGCVSNV